MLKKLLIAILGFFVWTLALQGLRQSQGNVQEHETHSAWTWLNSLSEDQNAQILFGSSNIAYSLDCARLDARCANPKFTFYNLGQRGMRGYELLDFILRFLDQVEPVSSLKTIYIEASLENRSEKPWNWRNVAVMSNASILETSILAAEYDEQTWGYWSALESMCQGMMMKCAAPLHFMLYPSNAPSRQGTKGFYPPPPIRPTPWVPNEHEERLMQPLKSNHDAWSDWLDSEGKISYLSDSIMQETVYPFDQLHTVVEHCRKRNIEVRMLFIPTASTIHLFDTLASITGKKPIVLGMQDDVKPFVTPEWLRDARHLNAKGVERVSDEFGQTICQSSN